jgi:hypothetical protein
MKIVWNKNPLKSTVELSEAEKEAFRLKVRVSELEEAVGMAEAYLDQAGDSEYFSPEKAKACLDRVQQDGSELEMYLDLLRELEDGTHCGDCTCVPSSCLKCHAEGILGIETTKGLRQHAAHYISGAFGRDGERTIDEALDNLANHTPVRSGGWLDLPQDQFDANVETWKKQAKSAHKWLLEYRDTKLRAAFTPSRPPSST